MSTGPIAQGANLVHLTTSFALVDEILGSFSQALGLDLPGYRNHVVRVLNYYGALSGGAEVPKVVLIAAAFHDIGIWTDDTFDYLEPSMRRASTYLADNLLEDLEPHVHALILEHHKLRAYHDEFAVTVETYRKADLVDLSLGFVRFGLSRAYVTSVKAALPNAGFHRKLVCLTMKQILRAPLRPLPMLRW